MSIGAMRSAGVNAAVCAVLGAGAGVAASAASPLHSTASVRGSRHTAKTWSAASWGGWFGGGMPVHGAVVVLDKRGTGYITETIDDGTLTAVSGDRLTFKEGTSSVPYKTITVIIPTAATVRRDGDSAALGDLKAGDVIAVRRSPDGTAVLAHGSATTGWSDGPGARGWGGYGPTGGGWPGDGRTGAWTTRGPSQSANW